MTEENGGRRCYNCQWAQEDVETFYNLLNNNIFPLSVLMFNTISFTKRLHYRFRRMPGEEALVTLALCLMKSTGYVGLLRGK